jgi:hypothetical protein
LISVLALNVKVIIKNQFGKDREESIRGLYEGILQHISGRTKKTQEMS